MARIVLIGEGMVELSRAGEAWRMGYGGDTLNTAIHLARFGHDVAFATALGTDAFSEELRAAWRTEGIDTSLILTDPERTVGMYVIRTDDAGERSFTYWRGDSAARRLCALPDWPRVAEATAGAVLVCYSLISLAVLPEQGRERIADLAARVRATGGRVAFDGNFRPKLWENLDIARQVHARAIAGCDIGLPTLEDEGTLCGTWSAASVAERWTMLGAGEVIVKTGASGCMADGMVVPPPELLIPVDTSGAGDAFNAGYLHGRLAGLPPAAAARIGHRLAGWVVMNAGAVPARTADAPYAIPPG